MKVLVIGGGGREHAVCRKLSESKDVTELLCAPGNAGIARVARCIPDVKATDIDGIVALAKREKVDFVCVTPDDPLALGCVDRLEAEGIAAFGPTAYAAQMEASKIFSKNLMRKYGIPTAKCEIFTEMEKALAYLDTQSAPIVVKADGLALGKGVVVAATIDEAKQAVIVRQLFGVSLFPVVALAAVTEIKTFQSTGRVSLGLPRAERMISGAFRQRRSRRQQQYTEHCQRAESHFFLHLWVLVSFFCILSHFPFKLNPL